jgi:hypothetical protein
MPGGGIAKSPRNGWMRFATGHKTKTKTQIEEPLTLMDSWDIISAREPLTPSSNPSEVVVFIDFDN